VTKRPPPRTATIDGQTMFILGPDEYERLAQARRQLGGYANRLNILKQHVRAAADVMDDIDAVLARHRPCAPGQPPGGAAPDCLLCAISTSRSTARTRSCSSTRSPASRSRPRITVLEAVSRILR
jgi:hypothetical protein